MFWQPRTSEAIKPGDIIGFSGESWLSVGIEVVTYGIPFVSLSHVGIIGRNSKNGRLLLFESTTLTELACEITGKPIAGSQAHSLDARLAHYRGKVWHYPLYRSLFPHEDQRLTQFLESTIGLPYNEIGAFRAGGIGFSWIESQLRERDMHSLFCSEWCAAAHAEIGIFATDDVHRWSPNLLARTERRKGILRKPRRLLCTPSLAA